MGFLREQFRKVIQWENDNPNIIVWKYPLKHKEEIMRKSRLVVREGQRAMFIQEGKLADVFEPGTYELKDIKNIPVLTRLYNWKFAFESPYTGDIYFISTKQFINNKWGTANPVMMRDQDFGMVRFRAFGIYSFAVSKPTDAMKELFGSMAQLTVKGVDDYFKRIVMSVLSTVVAESNIPALDLSMHYDDLSAAALEKAKVHFDNLGIEIKSLFIENISLTEESEKMLDKRTNVGIMSDKMEGYTRMETLGAMRDAAKNPSGIAGAGVGLGAGIGMGSIFGSNLRNMNSPVEESVVKCPNCHKTAPAGVKFCPECGKALKSEGAKCAKCGAALSDGAKFCPECGASTKMKCAKCGADISSGAKFCPECGNKTE
ncbi:MAG: SPFH domain-containing protein [Clostridia bacterium]|nr:SPFH domain-containing protein [Clostridia bacterium]